MKKDIQVKCIQCQVKFSYYQSKYRPFCSERCQLIDLGHWFEESYRVPAKEDDLNEVESEVLEGEENDEF